MDPIAIGKGILDWGWYETKRIIQAFPPAVLTAVVAWLTDISTNAGPGLSSVLAVGATMILLVIKNAVTDNTAKKTT